MKQLIEETEKADQELKKAQGPKSSHGYGGQFGVEKDRQGIRFEFFNVGSGLLMMRCVTSLLLLLLL